MNEIVLVALRRPYTFVVLAILILLFGTSAVLRTPTDIFPPIKIPVVAAIWTYAGLMPTDMSGRVVYYYERSLTTTVSNIEHIESQSYYGSGVVKIFFQPGTDVAAAQAQVAASSQTVLKQLPAGITPPNILVFDASSVPVLDLQIAANNMTPAEVYNLASNIIRPALVSVPGVAIPAPYGGVQEDVEVDLDQSKLLAHGLSAIDVGHALAEQNIVLPAGDLKIGAIDYMVATNATPVQIETFNNIPIKQVGNATVYLRDVAYVHEGGPPQQNVVVVKGQQSVLLQILKSGDASTLEVVSGVKAKIVALKKTLPEGVTITAINDASGFVKSSIFDVVREMIAAAILAGLAVLIFVGSWRSTLIVAASIPLSILSSIIALAWIGQTINVMTLGGLALAVGILVDDATVMIENINRHLEDAEHGRPIDLAQAIIDAANQIVVPTFVSTLCICIVWLPLLQLGGHGQPEVARRRGTMARSQQRFEAGFERFRAGYRDALSELARRRKSFVTGYLAVSFLSLVLVIFVGQDFFPGIKSGEIDLHVRFPTGTRIEESARLSVLVDGQIRALLQGHVTGTVSNCGLPISGINQAYSASGTAGSQDCDITISLDSDTSPVDQYRQTLRSGLNDRFPGAQFSFLPGDITAKILNFGLPSPIDVQVSGRDLEDNYAYGTKLAARVSKIAGASDVRIQQTFGQPTLRLNSRRTFALGTGLTEQNIADTALATLSGSGQTAPTYWLDVKSGVSHLVNIQTPQDQLTQLNDLQNIPVDQGDASADNAQVQVVGGLSSISNAGTPGVVSHYDILPVIDVFANVEGRDLGAVSRQVQTAIDGTTSELPKGATAVLKGQSSTMTAAYQELLIGLVLAIVLIYLVIVVNFQSWLDPFIVISALPAALAGVVWSLFLTGTTLSVPALTGAIMCMGTATANTILVVDFARVRLAEHGNAVAAAIEAGYARIRPVLMTALAMIVGMVPMSLSNTQNAPLGRAVIGGLLVATVTTLIFVPCIFAILHGSRQQTEPLA
jgi:multidrug efflux pump subunit AcrB